MPKAFFMLAHGTYRGWILAIRNARVEVACAVTRPRHNVKHQWKLPGTPRLMIIIITFLLLFKVDFLSFHDIACRFSSSLIDDALKRRLLKDARRRGFAIVTPAGWRYRHSAEKVEGLRRLILIGLAHYWRYFLFQLFIVARRHAALRPSAKSTPIAALIEKVPPGSLAHRSHRHTHDILAAQSCRPLSPGARVACTWASIIYISAEDDEDYGLSRRFLLFKRAGRRQQSCRDDGLSFIMPWWRCRAFFHDVSLDFSRVCSTAFRQRARKLSKAWIFSEQASLRYCFWFIVNVHAALSPPPPMVFTSMHSPSSASRRSFMCCCCYNATYVRQALYWSRRYFYLYKMLECKEWSALCVCNFHYLPAILLFRMVLSALHWLPVSFHLRLAMRLYTTRRCPSLLPHPTPHLRLQSKVSLPFKFPTLLFTPNFN